MTPEEQTLASIQKLMEHLQAARIEMMAIQSLVLGQLAVEYAHRHQQSADDCKAWMSDLTVTANEAPAALGRSPEYIAAALKMIAETLAGVEMTAHTLLERKKLN